MAHYCRFAIRTSFAAEMMSFSQMRQKKKRRIWNTHCWLEHCHRFDNIHRNEHINELCRRNKFQSIWKIFEMFWQHHSNRWFGSMSLLQHILRTALTQLKLKENTMCVCVTTIFKLFFLLYPIISIRTTHYLDYLERTCDFNQNENGDTILDCLSI